MLNQFNYMSLTFDTGVQESTVFLTPSSSKARYRELNFQKLSNTCISISKNIDCDEKKWYNVGYFALIYSTCS